MHDFDIGIDLARTLQSRSIYRWPLNQRFNGLGNMEGCIYMLSIMRGGDSQITKLRLAQGQPCEFRNHYIKFAYGHPLYKGLGSRVMFRIGQWGHFEMLDTSIAPAFDRSQWFVFITDQIFSENEIDLVYAGIDNPCYVESDKAPFFVRRGNFLYSLKTIDSPQPIPFKPSDHVGRNDYSWAGRPAVRSGSQPWYEIYGNNCRDRDGMRTALLS